MESGILSIGLQNPAFRIQNPAFRIQNPAKERIQTGHKLTSPIHFDGTDEILNMKFSTLLYYFLKQTIFWALLQVLISQV